MLSQILNVNQIGQVMPIPDIGLKRFITRLRFYIHEID